MLNCIFEKLCTIIGLLEEKVLQMCEVVEQQDLICEKLDVITDPDAECPDCPITEHTFRISAFDFDGGVFDADYVHTANVNGTLATGPAFNTSWVNKSEAYVNTVAAVNALSTASMSLVSDVAIGTNGKPEYDVTYDAGTTLTIVNNHNGDTYTFSTAEDGSCVATFVDSEGNAIESGAPVEQ